MKKMRPMILVVLALAIVTSLTAGTLAIYTTTTTLESNDVFAKRFVLTAAKTQSQSLDIKLAPADVRANGRGEEVYVTVSNYEGDVVSEVPIEVTFAINASGDLFKVDGLDVKIIDNADKNADKINKDGQSSWLYGYMASSKGLQKQYGPEGHAGNRKIILPAGVKTDRVFRIRFQWLDNGSSKNKAHTNAGNLQLTGSLSLSVSGVQYIE